jgi:hypothetical protein
MYYALLFVLCCFVMYVVLRVVLGFIVCVQFHYIFIVIIFYIIVIVVRVRMYVFIFVLFCFILISLYLCVFDCIY